MGHNRRVKGRGGGGGAGEVNNKTTFTIPSDINRN